MSYTNSPILSTYSSHRIPMAYALRLRPANQNWYAFSPLQVQDEGMVNALPIKKEGSDTLLGQTRPGINATYINNTAEANTVRGMHVWEKTAGTVYYFVVCGTKVYSTTDVTSGANWTQVNTLTTVATTPVRFTEFIDSTNTKKLVLVDGVEGYVFTSNAAGTKITDVNFPTPHIPFPIFLNARLYLAKAATGDIYNSNLDDPAAWTAGSFLSAEMYPDDIQALAKIDNYLLAIGTQSCEYFYDAGNAVGSPLARQEGSVLPFGCQFPNSIASNKDTVVLLANTNDGQSVFIAIEKQNYSPIDSSGVVPMYHRMLTSPNVGYEIAAVSCRGYLFKQGGVLYYSFLFDGVRVGQYATALFDACYTYSFTAKAWTELQYGSDTTDRNNRYAFPVKFVGYNTTGSLTPYVAGNVGVTGLAFFGKLDDLVGYDAITSLTNQQLYQEFRTPNLDWETLDRKTMSRLAIDVEAGDSTLQPVFTASWNDNDYNYSSWTAAVDFPTQNFGTTFDFFPFITQLGAFRRRAFRIVTVSGKPLTARYLEVDINKGTQ